ncbi:orotate phosphoribosyltransferase [Candidatus Methylacidithermus pantelleriae]|uniref:Orotate phosphoribosyltransferase n=1 Tax=Candidatus Methylacidithermus pantelleriae TaxID=2744239 RepID=A0A8J2BK00_9BACT|nr:orotate phosphoribosyltransferase [Candidatus Methylacidithermus pantelleriae]CAF0698791.1 Orotate phosphoribosyltransferase [Candidatus Methylacidithermus pantelleriae]
MSEQNISQSDASVLAILRETGALLEGHFILRSGLHSRVFVQCARVLQYPWIAQELSEKLAEKLPFHSFDCVVSAAYGGILVGHELARILRVRHFFTEKEGGKLRLRRFFLSPKEKVLVAEDVITTGSAVRETLQAVEEAHAEPLAVACLVDRSVTPLELGVPIFSLLRLPIEVYPPGELPKDLQKIPAVKPGSR